MSEKRAPRSLSCFHGEAFMLMTYRCALCGSTEKIWNSRDGVTPFMLVCRECKSPELQHADWQRDQFLPWYVPPVGSRVFVDLTPDRARIAAQRQAEEWSLRYGMAREELEEIRYNDMMQHGGVSPSVRTVASVTELFPNRQGIGYAGLRGLNVTFTDEVSE